MNSEKMKNMIVLKNLPSNILDEAIIVLKDNKKAKSLKKLEKQNNGIISQEETEDYIIKEAEMVISNYLSDIENNKKIKNQSMKKLEKKYKKLRNLSIMLGILLILSMII